MTLDVRSIFLTDLVSLKGGNLDLLIALVTLAFVLLVALHMLAVCWIALPAGAAEDAG